MYSTTNSAGAPAACKQPSVANASILDYQYDFGLGIANNGNVNQVSNRRDPTRTQNFTYDALDRISTGQTQTLGVTIPNANCWGLTFGYDPWGNQLSSSATGPAGCSEPLPTNFSVASNNRLLTNTVAGAITNYCYDSAGNLIHSVTAPANCPASGTFQYTYNAENQLTATAGLVYAYDGDGKRVSKAPLATPTQPNKLYWYGGGSDALDETDGTGSTANVAFNEYIFFGGKRIARRDSSNNVSYYFADHLGTARIVTNASGALLDDSDFYPFGGERPLLSSSGNTYKFTGKERDSESGLDNFGARYNASTLGRWMIPDLPFADQHPEDPQSWNMYAYVRNNPLAHVDPNGKACTALNNGSGFCQRADAYANFDALVHDKTRFFAAASAATQELADVAVPGLGRAGTSPETRTFLENTGEALLAVNTRIVGQILSGQIGTSGPDLDAQIVHIEQNAVQKGLDDLNRTDPTAYGAAIKELNGLLNGKSTTTANALAAVGGFFFPSDKAYAQILADVRKGLGHDIDFANQKDREAIGNALAQHVRETGGCVVTDNRARGCVE